jgi:hypothetical protein
VIGQSQSARGLLLVDAIVDRWDGGRSREGNVWLEIDDHA